MCHGFKNVHAVPVCIDVCVWGGTDLATCEKVLAPCGNRGMKWTMCNASRYVNAELFRVYLNTRTHTHTHTHTHVQPCGGLLPQQGQSCENSPEGFADTARCCKFPPSTTLISVLLLCGWVTLRMAITLCYMLKIVCS